MTTSPPPKKPDSSAIAALAKLVASIERLDAANPGGPKFAGYENGNGEEVGTRIDRDLARAKRILEKHQSHD
jgi:hypothetical protein